jgi:hypothetical protein
LLEVQELFFGEVELVAFAALGAAAATCGKLKADLYILAFEWETWDLGKVVDANAFVDVYASKKNTFGLVGLIGTAVTAAPRGGVTTAV